MAAPTSPRLAASFNDAVCLTPSPTTEERRAPPLERPSTPTTATDLETTTDRSLEGSSLQEEEEEDSQGVDSERRANCTTEEDSPYRAAKEDTCAENLSSCSRSSTSSSLHAVVNTENTETGRCQVFSFWLWQVIPHS